MPKEPSGGATTGVYIDDLRQQVWHTISQVLLIAAVVAIIAGVASMAVAR